jgi:hypothetical protein
LAEEFTLVSLQPLFLSLARRPLTPRFPFLAPRPAVKWDKYGINVWFFPRDDIPADITANQPTPSSWGQPVANFPSTSCDPYKYFYDNFNIFDTTLCGDWAGGVWNYADSGQKESQSCAAKTGYASCADYVKNNGDKFKDAYWEVKSVKYFNSTTEL